MDYYMSLCLAIISVLFLIRQFTYPAAYGKHVATGKKQNGFMVPAKYGWFIQELPSFLVPVVVILYRQQCNSLGCKMLSFMFCGHYFQRTFIYSAFTRGRPSPLRIVLMAVVFCTYNGFLQGHCLVYVAEYPKDWCMDLRFISGSTKRTRAIDALGTFSNGEAGGKMPKQQPWHTMSSHILCFRIKSKDLHLLDEYTAACLQKHCIHGVEWGRFLGIIQILPSDAQGREVNRFLVLRSPVFTPCLLWDL
ncbi:hypothetical protein XENTR_v10013781 [Xenopus tropicalis]|nr:hypothetical protein XENTR_v10013781 [Xenopus tropicalis]